MALLDLSTEETLETVKIDGVEYTLASFDSFSVSDQLRLSQFGKRVGALAAKESMTDDDASKVEAEAVGIFEMIAGEIPQAVRDRLQPGAKQRVVNAYFLAFAEHHGVQLPEAPQSGQADTSQASPDSTRE